WEILKKYNRKQFIARCVRGMFFQKVGGNQEAFKEYRDMLMQARPDFKYNLLSGLLVNIKATWLNTAYQLIGKYKWLGSGSKLFLKKYSRIQ
ncbi:MAG: hypothetical protein AAFP19_16005, partial [Bacteroidota bacterium]